MKICYFGIYDPNFGRNKIYIEGLRRAGHTVIECQDSSKGLAKYKLLLRKHKQIRDDYDFMIVGYPGHIVVPLARLISKRPVIADALGSLYDAELNSHNPTFFRRIKCWLIDCMMVKFADIILLESMGQKKYFDEKFGISNKYHVVYTGAEEMFGNFVSNEKQKKDGCLLVVFRGRLTVESGIICILKAAELLKNRDDIRFRIIGSGYFLKKSEQFIEEHCLSNTEITSRHLSNKDLVLKMSEANILLGQFGDNPRLSRTIPHKAFEAFALGIPYLSGNGEAISEITQDGKNIFLVPLNDPKALAQKIEYLAKDTAILSKVAEGARKNYANRFSSPHLVAAIIRAYNLLVK